MFAIEDEFDDDLLQAANDAVEDFLLATQLNEEEKRMSENKRRGEERDFELALKLAADLDESSGSDRTTVSTTNKDFGLARKFSSNAITNQNRSPFVPRQSEAKKRSLQSERADFKLALKLATEQEKNSEGDRRTPVLPNKNTRLPSGPRSNTNFGGTSGDQFRFASRFDSEKKIVSERILSDEERDFELALKLAAELDEYPDIDTNSSSERNANPVTVKNHDIDADYLLAVQLSAEGNERGQTVEDLNVSYEDFDSDLEIVEDNHAESDYLLAVQLSKTESPTKSRKPQKSYDNVQKYLTAKKSVVDPSWELEDPNPDIYGLFMAYNERFFWGQLDMVELKWSPQMTACAGVCVYHRRAGHCTIRLSKPLLRLRPRKDLIETLLHEMIHAYLFVTKNDRDRDGHGPNFHSHMYRINNESGANITVFHNFHDEVAYYQTHVWRCNGPCRDRRPFFGYVKRSRNRAPGPYDRWWSDHRATCDGTFVKIEEPEDYAKKKKSAAKTEGSSLVEKKNNHKIQNYFKTPVSSTSSNIPKPVVASSATSVSTTAVNIPSVAKEPTKRPLTTNKIFTLSDLAKMKRSPTKSPSGSPKKWAPLPGQRNILHFLSK